MQVVHRFCCQHIFLHQLKLEQLINMEKRYTHPSHPYACIHVEQFSILFFLCINNPNKLFELKKKLEFRELMYNMAGMGGDMT